jgi:hypothetical protein
MCFGNRGTKTEIIYAVERIIIRVGGCEVVIFFLSKHYQNLAILMFSYTYYNKRCKVSKQPCPIPSRSFNPIMCA